jgi:hypothetical protein
MDYLYNKVYIVGEIDQRAVALDMPWFRRTNLCLRHVQILETRPNSKHIDLENGRGIMYFWIPENDKLILNTTQFCSRKSESRNLKSENKAIRVLLEGYQNKLTGAFSNLKLLEHEVSPIFETYASS